MGDSTPLSVYAKARADGIEIRTDPKDTGLGGRPFGTCEICQSQDYIRPYGPKEEWVCFNCGMLDEPAAQRAFRKFRGY